MRPPCLKEAARFEKRLVVGVGALEVSNNPTAILMTYSLGSCLGITIYDPVKKIGGLLHIMLPDSTIDAAKAANAPFMFVDTGVPRLFHAAYNLGADRSRLVNIGIRNFDALGKLLTQNGLKAHNTDVGGLSSRTMRLDLTNGQVTIKTPGANLYPL